MQSQILNFSKKIKARTGQSRSQTADGEGGEGGEQSAQGGEQASSDEPPKHVRFCDTMEELTTLMKLEEMSPRAKQQLGPMV